MQLSRKHAIEVDPRARHISIFGGKLTDCLNVGEEICAAVRGLGVALPYPKRRWYGEPPATTRDEFFTRRALMNLDGDDLAELVRDAVHAPVASLRRARPSLAREHPRTTRNMATS